MLADALLDRATPSRITWRTLPVLAVGRSAVTAALPGISVTVAAH